MLVRPLAKSPMRPRTRRALRPTNANTPLRTPMGSLAKAQLKESEIRHNTISCELKALAKMVQDELGAMGAQAPGVGINPYTNNNVVGSLSLFERGRFYDEYSARRNERLMKKQSGAEKDEPKTAYNLGVKVESAKKKDSKKKAESLKKSVAAAYSVDRSQHPRYALRSTTKKPPLPVPMNAEEKTTTRKTAARRK